MRQLFFDSIKAVTLESLLKVDFFGPDSGTTAKRIIFEIDKAIANYELPIRVGGTL
ncbi:hypothetical protein D3C80_2080150 [compost metagenome]